MISIYGTDHRHSSIAERERACGAIARRSPRGASFFVTCNRVEIYGRGTRPPFDHHYEHHGEPEVYRHLVALAAGLTSQLLGERQIMDQLGGFSRAAGKGLGHLIAQALSEARRIRERFSIDTQYTVADAVFHNVRRRGLLGKKTVVVGTGAVAQHVAERFHRDSPLSFVSGKHKDRARALATRYKAEARPREELGKALEGASVVIAAAASPHHVIRRDHPVEGCALYDLSVPRTVDPALGAIDLERLDSEFETFNSDMRERVSAALAEIEKGYPS